jgi:hypothetical protein
MGGQVKTFGPVDDNVRAQIDRCAAAEDGSVAVLCADNHLGYCVPEHAEILTRRGWIRHDSVHVGDETIGYDAATKTSRWTPIVDVYRGEHDVERIGHSHWSAEATPNHRWLVSHRHWKHRTVHARTAFVEQARLNSESYIVLAAPFVGGSSPITPQESALVAWAITDGHVGIDRYANGERKVEINIYQSKPEGRRLLESTLVGVPHSSSYRERERTNYTTRHYRQTTEYANR